MSVDGSPGNVDEPLVSLPDDRETWTEGRGTFTEGPSTWTDDREIGTDGRWAVVKVGRRSGEDGLWGGFQRAVRADRQPPKDFTTFVPDGNGALLGAAKGLRPAAGLRNRADCDPRAERQRGACEQ